MVGATWLAGACFFPVTGGLVPQFFSLPSYDTLAVIHTYKKTGLFVARSFLVGQKLSFHRGFHRLLFVWLWPLLFVLG